MKLFALRRQQFHRPVDVVDVPGDVAAAVGDDREEGVLEQARLGGEVAVDAGDRGAEVSGELQPVTHSERP